MKTSLGLLEVSGLALAIGVADVMAKAASVTIIGMESTKGSGWTLVKIAGDVASVNAAIAGGAALARQHHGLVASAVLARPADSLRVHWQPTRPPGVPATTPPIDNPVSAPVADIPLSDADTAADAPQFAAETETESAIAAAPSVRPTARCNLCLDPACPRQKGERRFLCIHTGKRGKA
ncbi:MULTISPECIES: BMC domain-containing protein [unclassified Brenneria]|uniref:BMC domain-containing protein n=1 Tax=unclassified Brenneria TaxID=2634434 RepID=UPI0018F0B714|nr:BMC domain-containing protein [Brenneria sp. L3-3C-1]MEE3642813.1 BMC domain-containing protein [Brenneria sp. L3_3C_1]